MLGYFGDFFIGVAIRRVGGARTTNRLFEVDSEAPAFGLNLRQTFAIKRRLLARGNVEERSERRVLGDVLRVVGERDVRNRRREPERRVVKNGVIERGDGGDRRRGNET